MKKTGFIGAVVVALTMAGQAAQAQAVPAEFPPASFTGNQYVDSRGCAFVRAGLSGTVNWVPRVTRDRRQLCNFQPTFAQQVAPTVAPSAPNPLAGLPDATIENSSPFNTNVDIARPAPVAAPTPAPAPQVAAVPRPAPVAPPRVTGNVGAPIETVASLTTPPRLIQPIATATPPAAAPTPRVIPTPAAAPAERRITLAEACDGRFGIQRGFISAQTREPIDCGPAPVAATRTPVAAPVVAPVPVVPTERRITLAEACDGRFGVQPRFISAQTRQPIDCGPAPFAGTPAVAASVAAPGSDRAAASGPRRLTLAQACAEIAATGRPLTNAATGLPVRCAPQQQPDVTPRVFAGLPGPAVPAGPAAPRAPEINAPVAATVCDRPGSRYLMGGVGLPVRCGPQAQSPYSRVSQLAALAQQGQQVQVGEVTRRATAPASATLLGLNLSGEVPVPASNPQVYRAEPIRPPSGYQRVWGDGRLNERRGLPGMQRPNVYHENSRVVSQATVIRNTAPRATTSASTGHRYVQVGRFGDIGNAQATIRQFQQMGMPISSGRSGLAQVVALGPFSDAAALQRALQAARSAGFGDAYTRN